ncbi:HIT family protein [Tianweitania sp.]|uniref:HIT family protein n=1 Tax=Tianweitania sp. TaxID=2021634 RepID=UPI002899D2B1|nr:HIT family protein [Tianweitania sp.]
MTAAYDPDNIFAKILRGDLPAHRIYEDDHSFAFMDIMPRGEGHCVVIPKASARNLLDIPAGDLATLIQTVQHVAKAAVKAFDADGVTIEQFNEPAAGQSVYHLHFHVIPRFEGVALKPHSGTMEKPDVLAVNAEKMIGVLGN